MLAYGNYIPTVVCALPTAECVAATAQEAKTTWMDEVKALPFPPKSVFGSFESTIIKDRISGISAWFDAVLTTPGLKDSYGERSRTVSTAVNVL